MGKKNKKCILCGKQYTYCPTCQQDKDKPVWMNIYCSENCKNIFDGSTDYKAGEITEDQYKDILSKADLSRKNEFKDSVRKTIDELMSGKVDKVEVEKTEEVFGGIESVPIKEQSTVENENKETKSDKDNRKKSIELMSKKKN